MKLNEKQLNIIIDSYNRLDIAIENAENAGCFDIDGPLYDAIWRGFGNLIAIVDQDSWISWYINDNDMGKKGLSVVIDSKKIKVKTVKALLRVMYYEAA
jgi:hypothetical protein